MASVLRIQGQARAPATPFPETQCSIQSASSLIIHSFIHSFIHSLVHSPMPERHGPSQSLDGRQTLHEQAQHKHLVTIVRSATSAIGGMGATGTSNRYAKEATC